jgi:hypothetical protein
VSSEVKHKSKVSEAIILYIRVSAFPRVRTVAGNVCAEKTCEGISFGICTLCKSIQDFYQKKYLAKWKHKFVHTQPLVSDSSLYSSVMWYDVSESSEDKLKSGTRMTSPPCSVTKQRHRIPCREHLLIYNLKF